MQKRKLVILTAIVAIVVAYFFFDGGEYINIEYLKAKQLAFIQYRQAHSWQASALFFVAYILVTALSLPVAALMTMLAGVLFGLVWGTVLVSFAATIGACLAFLLVRYLFYDWVRQRWPSILQTIDKGVEREGAFYLFAIRLVALFPFFLVNIVMALTSMRTWTFYWVSQVGMLAGTIAYVNAGVAIGSISQPSDVLSVRLLIAFLILGLLPLALKKLLERLRR